MENEINKLMAIGREVELSTGEKITIKPFGFIDSGKVASILRNIKFNINDGEFDVLGLLADHASELAQGIQIATKWDNARMDNLGMDDALILLAAIWEENSDFFVQRIAPMLEKIIKK